MPTVLTVGPYRFQFFSNDGTEPPHIHVSRDTALAKYWLGSCSLAKNRGFRDHELNMIQRLVVEHRETLIEAWHDYFGS